MGLDFSQLYPYIILQKYGTIFKSKAMILPYIRNSSRYLEMLTDSFMSVFTMVSGRIGLRSKLGLFIYDPVIRMPHRKDK